MSTPPKTVTAEQWDQRYQAGDMPWDLGEPSPELLRVLAEYQTPPGVAIELGCGTGVNAVALAARGFHVTAIDFSETAIERARARAQTAGAAIELAVADVLDLPAEILQRGPFDFVFDRGCYHCVRRIGVEKYLHTLRQITRPGSRYLSLAGNPNEASQEGPPRVAEQDLRAELGRLFDIAHLRPFRFTEPDGSDGPLGWSCLLVRR